MAVSFQNNSSPSIEQITFFHDHAMVILSLITALTVYLTGSIMLANKFNNFVIEGQEIETIWTLLPAGMLIFIAFPSLNTLYLMEDTNTPHLTINISGHQWYWSYELTSLGTSESEMFLENSNSLRLLKTSELLALPANTLIRGLVTSVDVIHSWTIPSLGTNADALPGRLNQVFMFSNRLGIHTGQCSEICGINHSFMPILAQFYSPQEFIENINSAWDSSSTP